MITPELRNRVRKLIPYVFLPVAFPSHLLRPCIRILTYHRVARLAGYDQLTVTPERFEQQMATLASRWRVISLAQAVTELENGGPRTPAAVITFDDGYRDNLVHALPVLRRHGIPATVFVTARFSDQFRRHQRYPNEPGRLHLDWSEIVELAGDPSICIGSHTLTHPFLTRLDDARAAEEIRGSRREIEDRIGDQVAFFCYPSGDFTNRELGLVAAAGYRAAVTVCPGANRNIHERFALRRTEITDRDGAEELILKLMGAYDPLHLLLQRRREREFKQARRAKSPSAPTGRGT